MVKKCNDCNGNKESFDDMMRKINDNTKPFIETIISEFEVIREFTSHPDHLYKWHIDQEERSVEVLNENDWRFQFDNELPIKMQGIIDIPLGAIHRVIPGKTNLKIRIYKS
jgi:hypothetical protein